MTYQKLTKIIKDEKGREVVTCRFFGTDECRIIHKNGCDTCPMMSVFLNQLNAFETIYLKDVSEN